MPDPSSEASATAAVANAEDVIRATAGQDVVAEFLWRTAREGFAWVDPNGRIQAANPAFCSILGYSEHELRNKPFSEITVSDDAVHDLAEFSRLVNGEIESYAMTKQYRTKSQRLVTVQLFARRAPVGALFIGQVLPVDALSLDSLPPEAERRVLGMMIGRAVLEFAAHHWKAVAWILLALFGIVRMPDLFELLAK